MIYGGPSDHESIDQGDLIDDCLIAQPETYDLDDPARSEIKYAPSRILVLTQTCDLANDKASSATGAVVLDARDLVDRGLLKAADVRGAIRAGRVYGWYYLPASAAHGLPEMIVDLRQIHTLRLDMLMELCRRGKRRARLVCPYREHLARHFSDTYARIGLPEPYATE